MAGGQRTLPAGFWPVICGKARCKKPRATCAPWADRVVFRLGSGLSVLEPGEADDLIFAGMGAQTILDILDESPWVRDARYNLIFVPATKHSVLRRGLARRGFALRGETLCRAAGRWYTVMNAVYTGEATEPDGLACLCGLVAGQHGAGGVPHRAALQAAKYRRGLPAGPEADAVDALLQQMEDLLCP